MPKGLAKDEAGYSLIGILLATDAPNLHKLPRVKFVQLCAIRGKHMLTECGANQAKLLFPSFHSFSPGRHIKPSLACPVLVKTLPSAWQLIKLKTNTCCGERASDRWLKNSTSYQTLPPSNTLRLCLKLLPKLRAILTLPVMP